MIIKRIGSKTYDTDEQKENHPYARGIKKLNTAIDKSEVDFSKDLTSVASSIGHNIRRKMGLPYNRYKANKY